MANDRDGQRVEAAARGAGALPPTGDLGEEAEMPGLRKDERKSGRKGERKREAKGELAEVVLMAPGEGRPPFTHEPGPLEYLAPGLPLPAVGDVLVLPRQVTGDTKAQAFAWGGTVAPFVVVEREHVYFRDGAEKYDPVKPTPARYLRSLIYVRRLSKEEYAADPGSAGPGPSSAREA